MCLLSIDMAIAIFVSYCKSDIPKDGLVGPSPSIFLFVWQQQRSGKTCHVCILLAVAGGGYGQACLPGNLCNGMYLQCQNGTCLCYPGHAYINGACGEGIYSVCSSTLYIFIRVDCYMSYSTCLCVCQHTRWEIFSFDYFRPLFLHSTLYFHLGKFC